MLALERQKRILELLKENGAVLVGDLAALLGVTEETIRRDLEKLEAQKSLIRTHGGALPLEENTADLSLEERKNKNVESKKALARAAAQFIQSGDTIFLDASTTTFYLAHEIRSMKNVTVITTSLRVMTELAGVEGIKVIAVGGILSSNMSFVGSLAEESISKNYFASKMFFSSKGVTETAGIMDSNEHECGIKKRMIENSGKKYYICDKSKMGNIGYEKLAGFDAIDCFITDGELSRALKTVFDEQGIEIINV